jgi:hypothetical protein
LRRKFGGHAQLWPHHTSSPQYFHLNVRALLINALLGHVGGGHGGHAARDGNQQSGCSEERVWMHRMSVVLVAEQADWKILLSQVTAVQSSSPTAL